MSSEKISFSDGKITVHKKAIAQELQGKISDEDVGISESIISDMREKRMLSTKILAGHDCGDCAELKSDYIINQSSNRAAPYGNMNADILFASKMPTVLECGTYLSHSDTAGHFLMLILKKLGYNPDEFYFTDFVKCPNQKISVDDCWHCAVSYFLKEVNLVKPKILVCEGLSLLKILRDGNILLNIPNEMEYGVMYDSYFISEKTPIKVISIYELNLVLQKENADLQQCKNALWVQLTNIVQSIKS